MAKMILYCPETPDLKLGPGIKMGDPDIVVFVGGYAEIDEADPLFEAKMSWVRHSGTPPIRVLGKDEAPSTAPGAVTCPVCGKYFADDDKSTGEARLNGHLIQHRRKG